MCRVFGTLLRPLAIEEVFFQKKGGKLLARSSQEILSLLSEILTQQGYHTPVMLWGPPGVGKSQIVAQVAENHGAVIVDIRLSQMEPSDLRGIPFKNGQKVEWAIPAMLPDVAVHGEAPVYRSGTKS